MAGEIEAMGIPDVCLQALHIRHIHIKNAAALFSADVIVFMAPMLKSVGAAGHLNFADLSHFRQPVQIPVHGCPADVRTLRRDDIVDLIRGNMPRHTVDRLQNQGTLNGTNLTRYVIPSGIVL